MTTRLPETRLDGRPTRLPLGSFRCRAWALVASIGLAVLAGLAAVAGLAFGSIYPGPPSVVAILRGFDIVTLGAAVPILVVSVVHADRGSDRAALVWVGILTYLVYTYAFYVFAIGFSGLFLLHIAVFSASLLALIAALSGVDATGIADRFGQRTPTRLVAVLLALLAAGLGGLWVTSLVRYAITGAVPAGSALVEPDVVVHVAIGLDLALLVPAYALAAGLLWRRIGIGYVLAAMVLVSGVLHQVSYMLALPLQVDAGVRGAVGVDPAEPVIAMLFLLTCALVIHGAGTRPESGPGGDAKDR